MKVNSVKFIKMKQLYMYDVIIYVIQSCVMQLTWSKYRIVSLLKQNCEQTFMKKNQLFLMYSTLPVFTSVYQCLPITTDAMCLTCIFFSYLFFKFNMYSIFIPNMLNN